MELFKQLELYRWRQIENIKIDFCDNLCVLTGPNGCGKTTVLNVLGKHFGWDIHFVSTPFLSRKKNKKFWTDVWEEKDFETDNQAIQVGSIEYISGHKCILMTTKSTTPQYILQYNNQKGVAGLHIPSHRPVVNYQNIQTIPTNPKKSQQHFEEFRQLMFQTYGSDTVKNPGMVLKKSLVALAVFGYGSESVIPNYEYKELFERFQEILRIILPEEIGFERLEIRMPDIVLITESGDFSLDAMSGGIGDILGMAWQIHMYGADKKNCTILIDEPENHLHPNMQRNFLPSFKTAFPDYKFIIATHSPFIVSSEPNAAIYALLFNENKKVVSERLSKADLAASPNKILREILDVPTVIPIWVEERIKQVLKKYSDNIETSEDNANKIYAELQEIGLSESVGEFTSVE